VKTLHPTNAWHAKSGGIATMYRAILRAAEERGHEMRLIVPSGSTSVEEVGRHGRIYHLRAPAAPFNGGYRILYPHRYLFPRGDILRIIDTERPDLIETTDKYTLLYLGGLLRIRAHPLLRFRPAVVGLSCERMDENTAAYLSGASAALALTRLYMRWLYLPLWITTLRSATIPRPSCGVFRAAIRWSAASGCFRWAPIPRCSLPHGERR